MKLSHLAGGVVLTFLVVLFVGAAIRDADDLELSAPPALEPSQVIKPSDYSETWGPEGAPVLLQACLPRRNAMAENVVDAFRSVSARRPGRVRAEIIDMRHPNARSALGLRGINTPVVAVNSRTDYTVRLAGKRKRVSLASLEQLRSLPLEEVFEQIVRQELEQARDP